MRKIENADDWDKFTKECFRNCGSMILKFGVSQNGDEIDGYFSARIIVFAARGYLCFEDPEKKDKWFYAKNFYDELTEKYDVPFYLVDVRANNSWF